MNRKDEIIRMAKEAGFLDELTAEKEPDQPVPKQSPEFADRWQHRSKHMRCVTCMWWVEKHAGVGRCRRHAPTMNGYPVAYHNDWCGDHKINEHTEKMP